MSLPFPPKHDLPMPPPLARPDMTPGGQGALGLGTRRPPIPSADEILSSQTGYDPDVDENHFTHVRKVGHDKALVRIGDNLAFLTRLECNYLIGQLERVARRL